MKTKKKKAVAKRPKLKLTMVSTPTFVAPEPAEENKKLKEDLKASQDAGFRAEQKIEELNSMLKKQSTDLSELLIKLQNTESERNRATAALEQLKSEMSKVSAKPRFLMIRDSKKNYFSNVEGGSGAAIIETLSLYELTLLIKDSSIREKAEPVVAEALRANPRNDQTLAMLQDRVVQILVQQENLKGV